MTIAQSYWSESGKYQSLYESMKDQIPELGESDDPNIELLRCGVNVYYDCYNNGGGNLDSRSDQLDCILDNKEVISKVDPKIWKQFKDTIEAHRDQLVDPEEVEEEVPCCECDGSGEIECSECCGSTEIECDECDGEGVLDGEDCDSCDGTGEIECVHCGGDGYDDCDYCDGSGYETETVEESQQCLDSESQWEGPLESVMDAIILIVSEKLESQPKLPGIQ